MTDRETLVQAVREHADQVEQWELRVEQAQEALRNVESVRGEDLLDNPDLVDELSGTNEAARERIALAERAADAARARLDEARAAVLEFDAGWLEVEEVAAKQRLAEHTRKTERLLSQLEKHEGRFVPVAELEQAQRRADVFFADAGPASAPPKSRTLEVEAQIAQLRVAVLRDVAAGVDPALRLTDHQWGDWSGTSGPNVCGVPLDEFYPASVWGPDAVIPCPAFLRVVDDAESDLYALDVQEERLREELASYEARLVQHQERLAQPRVYGDGVWRLEVEDAVRSLREGIPRVKRELAAIPAQRATAAAKLRELREGSADASLGDTTAAVAS